MASIKQIEANRLNALKHGLFAESAVIKGEIPADFDKLRDSWVLRWQPATPRCCLAVSARSRC